MSGIFSVVGLGLVVVVVGDVVLVVVIVVVVMVVVVVEIEDVGEFWKMVELGVLIQFSCTAVRWGFDHNSFDFENWLMRLDVLES